MRNLVACAALAAAAGPACRLDPLVDDTPGASAAILPADAVVPSVATNGELTNQITFNDGLDSRALMASSNIIPRGSGFAGNGMAVRFWSFGTVDRAPAPMYVFGTGDPMSSSFVQNDHPPLVDALPGDAEYAPLHTIYRVVVTDRYHGEKITTTAALADAVAIGMVEPPVALKNFVDMPIVRPGTRLDTGATAPAMPIPVYGRGYTVDAYQLGGPFAVQSNPLGLLPTSQVSFLRGSTEAVYNTARPIFQASVPTTNNPAYTSLCVVVNVDINGDAMNVTSDGEMFTRGMNGEITARTGIVQSFTVTTVQLDLQMQFMEGQP